MTTMVTAWKELGASYFNSTEKNRPQNTYKVTVLLNEVNVTMKIDDGETVVDKKTFHNLSQQHGVLQMNPVNAVPRTQWSGSVSKM